MAMAYPVLAMSCPCIAGVLCPNMLIWLLEYVCRLLLSPQACPTRAPERLLCSLGPRAGWRSRPPRGAASGTLPRLPHHSGPMTTRHPPAVRAPVPVEWCRRARLALQRAIPLPARASGGFPACPSRIARHVASPCCPRDNIHPDNSHQHPYRSVLHCQLCVSNLLDISARLEILVPKVLRNKIFVTTGQNIYIREIS
jgi:hypothetical protein